MQQPCGRACRALGWDMNRRMHVALVLASAMVATSCTSSTYDIPADKLASAVATGMNMTGRADITEGQWMAIAARACNEGGWDWEGASRIADEMIGEVLGPDSGAAVVWLMAAAACHELIPEDALLRGPPGLESPGALDPPGRQPE